MSPKRLDKSYCGGIRYYRGEQRRATMRYWKTRPKRVRCDTNIDLYRSKILQ